MEHLTLLGWYRERRTQWTQIPALRGPDFLTGGRRLRIEQEGKCWRSVGEVQEGTPSPLRGEGAGRGEDVALAESDQSIVEKRKKRW